MRRLTAALRRRLGPRYLAGERGASAVMVALLLVPLLGCGALAVDAAAIYGDRAQLRNAADAAALAIAADCARGTCTGPTTTTRSMLAANVTAGGVTTLTPTTSLNSGARTVTVTTSADVTNNFAHVLGHPTTRLTTRSTASWAPTSGGLAAFPLAISWCEFKDQMDRDPTGRATMRVNAQTDLQENRSCRGPDGSSQVQAGYAVTNGDGANGSCGTTSSIGGTVTQFTGMYTTFYRLPVSCSNAYLAGLLGTTVIIPIWDKMEGPVGSAEFQVYAYAAFHLEGYDYLYSPEDPALIGRFTRAALLSASGTPATVPRSAPDLAQISSAYRGAYSVFLDPQG